MTDFRAARYDQAANELENALLRPGIDGRRGQYLHYYLGLSYEQLGKRELAVAALKRFVETSPSWGTQRYDVAEVRLILAGQPMRRCRSQDPVIIPWK